MTEKFGAFSHKVIAPSHQIPGSPHLGWIDVGHREVTAANQSGNLQRVNPVILGFDAVNRLDVKGVTQHKVDPFLFAYIGQPVPAENALHANNDIAPKRFNGLKKSVGLAGNVFVIDLFSIFVQNANIHGSCVQIDFASRVKRGAQ